MLNNRLIKSLRKAYNSWKDTKSVSMFREVLMLSLSRERHLKCLNKEIYILKKSIDDNPIENDYKDLDRARLSLFRGDRIYTHLVNRGAEFYGSERYSNGLNLAFGELEKALEFSQYVREIANEDSIYDVERSRIL